MGPRATHLITTYDEQSGLVPIHNVKMSEVRLQAEVLRMKFIGVPLPTNCPNTMYIEQFKKACSGFEAIVFGDLFLADIREFREQSFPEWSLEFPLWGRDTSELAREMIACGLQASVTAAQDAAWIGRKFDDRFLSDLPSGTDYCGENGEFHTWVEPECLVSFR